MDKVVPATLYLTVSSVRHYMFCKHDNCTTSLLAEISILYVENASQQQTPIICYLTAPPNTNQTKASLVLHIL